ncbi:MAG TPA: transglutaminase-like domain-containing protein [Candidatus Nanoarchaeia archaeon]|nr:transglutaminase-like domain-containing protein [Candidatus Nanoarchaeia archaeon]
MATKKIIWSVLLVLLFLFFLVSCALQEPTDEPVEIVNEQGNLVGEAIKYSKGVYQIKANEVTLEKEEYLESFDLQTLPKKAEVTALYLKKLNYPGNLGPFPTKSLQSYALLKEYGIVDSEEVNLQGFYLSEGPQTEITDIVQNNANLIKNGATTEEAVKNIMDWEQAVLSCSQQEAQQYQKRERTAHQIILSKCATGCTDYVLVFAALARAKGIPATITETVREKWIAEMVWNNKWNPKKEGHFFSEVYLPESKVWVVVDPTANKLTGRDDKGYYQSGPGGDKRFMLFERGLDSWDYGIKTDTEFGDMVKKRYYIELGDQP